MDPCLKNAIDRYFHAKAGEIPAALDFPSPSLLSDKKKSRRFLSFFFSFPSFLLPLFLHRFLSFLSFHTPPPPRFEESAVSTKVSKRFASLSPRHSTKRDARCSTGKVATLLRHARFHSRGLEDTEASREWRFSSENIRAEMRVGRSGG